MGSSWGGIIKVGRDLESIGIDFVSSFDRKLGDGMDISFWEDKWCGGEAIRDRFSRLYYLAKDRNAYVRDMGVWRGSDWVWSWDWVREPRGRATGEVEALDNLLANVKPSPDCRDNWIWNLDNDGVFTVKALAFLVDELFLQVGAADRETKRNNLIPKKVGVFMWRALKGRLPVRVELDKRGIDLDSLLCKMCGDEVEKVNHCLANCSLAKDIWGKIFNWWKLTPSRYSSFSEIVANSGDIARNSRIQHGFLVTAYGELEITNFLGIKFVLQGLF